MVETGRERWEKKWTQNWVSAPVDVLLTPTYTPHTAQIPLLLSRNPPSPLA